MILSLVNVFEIEYEKWRQREPSFEEAKSHLEKTGEMMFMVNDQLEARIANHIEAARYMLQRTVDNGLENHIDNHLHNSFEFKDMVAHMPVSTPDSIESYKKSYPSYNSVQVSKDIDCIGKKLHEGQYLFHGGFCPAEQGDVILTDRPFSTSFCPQVALRNAEWGGKAYDNGEIHLCVLKVSDAKTNAFVFPLDGEMNNEKEVLFAESAKLTIISKELIRSDYSVYKSDGYFNTTEIKVPAYLVQIEVS
ncbi:hypothetical protein ACXQF3_001062 [Vibrio fluvialis]|nr:hypothetical protein [Vibrio fluvialis]MBY7937508.1 hypothetical protein [Vibrio fluvialis]